MKIRKTSSKQQVPKGDITQIFSVAQTKQKLKPILAFEFRFFMTKTKNNLMKIKRRKPPSLFSDKIHYIKIKTSSSHFFDTYNNKII